MSRKEALSQFIQQIHGRPVVVKLNSGVDYRGKTVNILTNSPFFWFHKFFVA
jgi:small nuclear ribonucleoprotein (snRNP)-like protein